MVIDFHTHIYPEKIAAKAVANIGEFYNSPMQGNGTAEGLLESGRRSNSPLFKGSAFGGIERFVVFSAAAVPAQVQAINDYIASACREHSQFSGFGTLHKDMEDPQAEIDRIISLGLKGVKFHPDMQRFNIDDDEMMNIYAALEGRLWVIFHTGDYRHDFSHPSRLARVLDNFPKLQVVAAHFGGWSVSDIAFDYFIKRSCFFDVSSSLPFIGKNRAAEFIHTYGAQRFLFGSDYPMWDPAACLNEFLELDLSYNEKEMILWKNAEEILG